VGFTTLFDEDKALLMTASDSAGAFSMPSLPEAAAYEIVVRSAEGCGSIQLPLDDVVGKSVTIKVFPLYYERLRFNDDAGRPVAVSGSVLGLTYGAFHWSSEFASPDDRMLVDLRLETTLEENELLAFSQAPQEQQTTVHIPGYLPLTVLRAYRPLSEWPAARDVSITRDRASSARLYRVEFPPLRYPEGWVETAGIRFVVRVGIEQEATSRVVSRSKNVFFAPDRTALALALEPGATPIPFELERRDDNVIVIPRLPDLGFVSVYYEAAASRVAVPMIVSRASTNRLAIHEMMERIYPGYARTGPIPTGPYAVVVQWFAASGETSATVRREIEVHAGHNVVECR
jgi:hypothetical protein